jgi:hypothetical protein
MFNNYVRNRCLTAPSLLQSTGAGSLTTAMYSAFRFMANGNVSSRVVAADAPALTAATLVPAVLPNGTATVVGTLAADAVAGGSTAVAAQRIYTLVATLPDPVTSPLGSPTFSWIAGADFTRARLPQASDFAWPQQANQCAVGFWWIANASSGVFTPGTTNPFSTSGITNVFFDNYAGFSV